ncbi:lipopolysaccharide assembly protein LapA domain-containing protein [Streptomyces sp. NPDC093094]|uniref:lipopolysaccharide assembly protein LapA domain-containing protein n=1 Tax=Streptomyces sp. NPDC093094 TaxID=3366026 RepID=UPI0037F35E36
MSPKLTDSGKSTTKEGGRGGVMTPGRWFVLALGVLGLIFIFENTQSTEIRLLIPVVTMPLWVALLITMIIGVLCGAFLARRRR